MGTKMIGKVIEGRYVGASVNKVPDKNILFIQTEDGTKIALSKSNVISIDDVTEQYPSGGRKVMMVMWNDFETSIIQIGKSVITAPKEPVETEIREKKKTIPHSKKKRNGPILGLTVAVIVLVVMVVVAGVTGLFDRSTSVSENIVENTTEGKLDESDAWNIGYPKDDFGEVAGLPYIYTEIDGTYTTESKPETYAKITFSHGSYVYESGYIQSHFAIRATKGSAKANADIACPATIKLKIGDTIHEERLSIAGGYEVGLYADDNEYAHIYQIIFDALMNGEDVQVSFDDYRHTKYIFTVPADGFREAIGSTLAVLQQTYESETEDVPEEKEQDLRDVVYALQHETLQYPSQNDEWKYDVYESHVCITQYIGNSSIATIPAEIDGVPVKGIGPSLDDGNPFEEIVIPDTITYVGVYAFSGMPVKRVTFESDNKIVFSESVFAWCTSLENMDDIVAHIYGDTIPARMFSAKYKYSSSYITYDDYNLDDEVYLPPNIKRIGEEAFCGLTKLKKINLENVEQVDEEAFYNAGITEADFSSLTTLEKNAFRGCPIQEVVLHKVVDIPEGAFAWCGAEMMDLGIAQTIGEDALPRMLPALYIRNASCEIKSSAFGYLVNDEMIVYGFPGSTAAKFASDYNCTFKNIDAPSVTTVDEPTATEKPNTSIYHWNEVKNFSFPLADVQVHTYKVENIEGATPAYAIEITCDSMTSKELMTFMIHSTDDWGFDRISLAERIQKVLDMYDDVWTNDTMMYCSMSGYGIEWTVSLGTDEHFCGIIGLTTNKPNEFEAVLGMMPQD